MGKNRGKLQVAIAHFAGTQSIAVLVTDQLKYQAEETVTLMAMHNHHPHTLSVYQDL